MNREQQLKQHFELVSETMADLPVFNAELSVATIGFMEYQQCVFGVLITPWFMNLIMIPDETESMTDDKLSGTKQMLSLPSGQYEFIWGYVEGFGSYQSCSLFSPMFEFETQQEAIDTAKEVMKALFVVENYAPTDRQIAATNTEAVDKAELVEKVSGQRERDKQVEKEITPELSRRGFLSGKFRTKPVESEAKRESL